MKKIRCKVVLGTVCTMLLLILIWAVSGSFDITNIYIQGLWRLGTKTNKAVDSAAGPNIFFVETSGRSYLTLREVCAVESAARAHPGSNVTLLTSTWEPIASLSDGGSTRWMRVGPDLAPNLVPALLNVPDILEGTPLAQWYSSGAHRLGEFHAEHLSDALRLALLWKRGGIYLDLDVIALRSLGQLRDAVGLESREGANGAVLAFRRKSPFLKSCMKEYVNDYKPHVWGHQGPLLLTRMLRQACGGVENLMDFVARPHKCRGVTVLPPISFYPLQYQNWQDLFAPADQIVQLERVRDFSFTVHLWAKLSRSMSAKVGGGSVIDSLTKQYCPSTYRYISTQNTF